MLRLDGIALHAGDRAGARIWSLPQARVANRLGFGYSDASVRSVYDDEVDLLKAGNRADFKSKHEGRSGASADRLTVGG